MLLELAEPPGKSLFKWCSGWDTTEQSWGCEHTHTAPLLRTGWAGSKQAVSQSAAIQQIPLDLNYDLPKLTWIIKTILSRRTALSP